MNLQSDKFFVYQVNFMYWLFIIQIEFEKINAILVSKIISLIKLLEGMIRRISMGLKC